MSLWDNEPVLIKPMLAFPAKPFDSKDYLMEIKYDGTRGIAYLDNENKKLMLLNRRGKFFQYRYPEFSNILDSINAKKAILDGEVVIFKDGKPDFYELEKREQTENISKIELFSKISPAVYVVFDILHLNGEDLLNKPLIERKKLLEDTLSEDNYLIYSRYIIGKGKEFFSKIKRKGLEGIMAKKIDSFYQQGRSKDWLKIKATNTLDAVVIGYTSSDKEDLSALLLGIYEKNKIKYIGRIGTGFDEEKRREILAMLKKLGKYNYNLDLRLGKDKRAFMVRPEVVVEVKYMEITKGKMLRAPSFVRIRNDKPPKECILEGEL
jgi:bifunctional non-homologous end joining protein LigD